MTNERPLGELSRTLRSAALVMAIGEFNESLATGSLEKRLLRAARWR